MSYSMETEKWFDSLDRTNLGRFAVKDDALKAAYELMTASLDVASNLSLGIESYDKGRMTLEPLIATFEVLAPDRKIKAVVNGELLLWTGEYGYGASHPAIYEKRWFLNLVNKNPASYHDYFAVGITKTSFIERCVKSGIDPELALSMGVPT